MDSNGIGFRSRYKTFRKKMLSYMPFIRRSRHERVCNRFKAALLLERRAKEAMGWLLLDPPSLASTARHNLRLPIINASVDELCLFVTHAPNMTLKPHVIDHVEALLDAGVAVVLIANADVDPCALEIPHGLAARLYGCLIRENIGYDFAAWAHAYAFVARHAVRQRLYLINDSIVGPLDRETYGAFLQRVRDARADFVGLTYNLEPQRHLQSYFLVFNERLLHSDVCDSFMRRVVNMPAKQNVIDSYEILLTRFLEQKGFTSAAIFPILANEHSKQRNDTFGSWSKLVDLGFPFIKSMVLRDPLHRTAARRRVPARYLESD